MIDALAPLVNATASEAAPAFAVMVEVSCAVTLIVSAVMPVAPSPSTIAFTSAAMWFSVLTPEPPMLSA